jgi:hypothetical protein
MPNAALEAKAMTGGEGVVLRTAGREIGLSRSATEKTPGYRAVSRLDQAAMQWTYIVRNRLRWSSSPDSIRQHARDAESLLKSLGVEDEALRQLARARIVEVSIPWSGVEADDWPARILPWEYVVASGSKTSPNGGPLTVMRHLRRPNEEAKRVTKAHKSVLFVVGAPGPLQDYYKFDTERELVRNNLGAGPKGHCAWNELNNPTVDQLREALQHLKPDIVHFTGIETHHAISMLSQIEKEKGLKVEARWDRDPALDPAVKDGYVLKGAVHELTAVDAEAFANILANCDANGVPQPPRLVAFNFYNSAARVAALSVAHGVETAIGFQDSYDDDQAERFFADFYAQLTKTGGASAAPFCHAWERIRELDGHQQATGVVRWSATALTPEELNEKVAKKPAPRTGAAGIVEPATIEPNEIAPGDIDKLIKVTVRVHDEINYSVLHNNKSLFSKFNFMLTPQNYPEIDKRDAPLTLHRVTINVSLDVGGGSASYRRTLSVVEGMKDLSEQIQLPLTSSLTRAVHESIVTSVIVEVAWGQHVLFQDSLRVRLTPVDQWRDSDSDRQWLPSFVFPRDPATSKLVDDAQRYVRVLRDDPASGFDGYQSFVPGPGSPVAAAEEVDLQVQAVWSAIVHEMRLTYVNPPPGYSSTLDSQRLRTPSMIRRYHCGTCIDLALFFAACLELIDVYPVIFLLDGHAFPGYWRSDAYHQEFQQAKAEHIEISATGGAVNAEGVDAQSVAWFFKQDTGEEILSYVRDGKLVPIESVRLTENCGFWEAIDAGLDNLRDHREFQAMVDIKLARDQQVTPIPILGDET